MATVYVAVNGSDSNAGTSASPFETINKALDSLGGPGTQANPHVIILKNGVYDITNGKAIKGGNGKENGQISLTPTRAWVTIKAENPRQAILRGKWSPALLRPKGTYPVPEGYPVIRGNPWEMPNPREYGTENTRAFGISANGIRIEGIVFEHIAGSAIEHGSGSYVTIHNCVTYWIGGQGINSDSPGTTAYAATDTNITLTNNTVLFSSTKSLSPAWIGEVSRDGKPRPDAASGALRLGGMAGPSIVSGNEVAFCFGEGMDIGKWNEGTPQNPIIIENNKVHDNRHVNIYVLHSRFVHVRNNCCYNCDGVIMLRSDGGGNPFTQRDERQEHFKSPSSYDIYFYNNVGVGGASTLLVNEQEPGWQPKKNIYAGFNTFVGDRHTFRGVITFNNGGTTGIVENNIVVTNQMPAANKVASISSTLTVRGNAYTRAPSNNSSQNIVAANLGLANPGLVLRSTGWGPNTQAANFGFYMTYADHIANVSDNFNVANYHISGSSVVRDRAGARTQGGTLMPPIQPFQKDYLGRTRVNPDMGFHESDGATTPTYSAAFTRNPSGTTLNVGTTVALTNESSFTNTNLVGYSWVVKKGTTTVATATTIHYNYTFTSTGNYSIALTITTGAGSDTATVNYVIQEPAGEPSVVAAFTRNPATTSFPQGTTVRVTDTSVIQNASFVSRQWHRRLGAGAWTLLGTTSPLDILFDEAGSYEIRLTENVSGGLSDTEIVAINVSGYEVPNVSISIGSNDPDNEIDAGQSITFTGSAEATNTTVTTITWTILRGDEVIHTATGANLTYTFAQPGSYIVRARVDTLAGVFDLDEIPVVVRVVGAEGDNYDFIVAPARAAVHTSVSTQTILSTAMGDTVPKAAIFRMTLATAAGTAVNGSLYCEGLATEGAQSAHVRYSPNGTANSLPKRRYRTDSVLLAIDDTGAITGRAEFSQFVAGGVEIKILDAFPVAYLVEVILFGGDDCQAWSGTVTIGAAGVDVPVSAGFNPDLVYAASSWASAIDTAENDGQMSLGFCLRDGTQWSIRHVDVGDRDPSVVSTTHKPRLATARLAGGQYGSVACDTFTNSGFVVRSADKTFNLALSLLAIATGGKTVTLTSGTTLTPSPSVHPLAFEAQTILGLLSSTRTPDTTISGTPDSTCVGTYTVSVHDSYESSVVTAEQHGAATTVTRSLLSNDFALLYHDSTLLAAGSGTLGASGLSIAWSTAPANPYYWLMLAIEKGVLVEAPPAEDPIANFSVSVEVQAGRVVAWFNSSTSSGNGQAITGHAWDFGDGQTSTEANPYHVYAAPGRYTVSLTVTTATGSNTKTLTDAVVFEIVETGQWLVGPIPPQTSGGATTNYYDDRGHTHEIRFDPMAHFLELSGESLTAFLAAELEPPYALFGYDKDNHRVIIRESDGTIRYIPTSAS
jgi:PKD repeat protein